MKMSLLCLKAIAIDVNLATKSKSFFLMMKNAFGLYSKNIHCKLLKCTKTTNSPCQFLPCQLPLPVSFQLESRTSTRTICHCLEVEVVIGMQGRMVIRSLMLNYASKSNYESEYLDLEVIFAFHHLSALETCCSNYNCAVKTGKRNRKLKRRTI